MKKRTTAFFNRVLASIFAFSCFVAPTLLYAADDEEAASNDPVWVLSYAAFILFVGATVIIAIFFSKRGDSVLDMEEQKRVNQLRADRVQKKRREERLAALHGGRR